MRLGWLRRLLFPAILGWMAAPAACWATAVAGPEASRSREVTSAVLYLFAHQDDEYFILARMARDVAEGRAVHAAWITDGAKRGSAARRNAESSAVMERIGVPRGNLHFLGFPDQDSIGHLPEIHQRMRELDEQFRFAEVTTPAYEGGNIDHDVAALIGARLVAARLGRMGHFEFPLYNHYEGRGRVGVFLPAAGAVVRYTPLEQADWAVARRALWTYRSQRWLLLALRMRCDRKTLRALGEPYRCAPAYDFLARPAQEPCGYEVERRRRAPFTRWLQAVEPFLHECQTRDGVRPGETPSGARPG